ncbi:P2Y purinoceptor 14-like [Halichoeres trimaculatus]|uniref:P2Y purinoceptor 14-like n=1 Tax=Halichoeres trimaculatus TaxID=147232 RepID=UPI003D9DB65F
MAEPPSNQTSVDCGQIDTSAKVIFVFVYCLMFLVGLVLNGFTLKVYFCSHQRQVSDGLTIYLKNLAAADFLIGLCLPLRISRFISSLVPVFRVYCSFGATTFYLNMYASILFMGYIAADRYMKMVHDSKNHFLRTPRAAKIISAVTWVFLLASMTLYISLKLLAQEPQNLSGTISCRTQLNEDLRLLYKIILGYSAAIFLLVLVSLIFFYYSTSRKLATQQQKSVSSNPGKLIKSRRTMLALVCVFCVCFVPYHLVRLPYTFLKSQCSWGLFYLKEVAVLVSSLNVCLDPLLYFLFCKEYRAQMWGSIRRQQQGSTGQKL